MSVRKGLMVAWATLITSAVLMAMLALSGCSQAGGGLSSAKVTTSESARASEAGVSQMQIHFDAVWNFATHLADDSPVKSILIAMLTPIADDVKIIKGSVAKTIKGAAADAEDIKAKQKEIDDLKAADPVRWWLRYCGLFLMGLCIIVWICSFFPFGSFLAAWREPASAVGIIGIISVGIAQMLPTIDLIIKWGVYAALGVAIGWIIWRLWKNHWTLTGLVNLTPGGAAMVKGAAKLPMMK